jgi:hypothetical protein
MYEVDLRSRFTINEMARAGMPRPFLKSNTLSELKIIKSPAFARHRLFIKSFIEYVIEPVAYPVLSGLLVRYHRTAP